MNILRSKKKVVAPKKDRRVPDPWRDDVDSHLRFLRAEAGQSKVDRAQFRTELDTHTQMLTDGGARLKSIDGKLDELAPFITGLKVARRVGVWGKLATLAASKLGHLIAFVAGLGILFTVIKSGGGWSAAWRAFIDFMGK